MPSLGRFLSVDPVERGSCNDSLGRLIAAKTATQQLAYGCGAVAGCVVAPDAGKNTNRSSVSLNGGTPVTYCYDKADRLISSTDPALSTVAYDARGQTKALGAQAMSWDGADRHTGTSASGGALVTYRRDATNRTVERTEDSTTVRYGYTGSGDSTAFTMTTANAVVDRHLGLVGGALLTRTSAGQTWDYPNIHGDIVVTADAAGAQVGGKRTYDPFGPALAGLPNNETGNLDYGWLGSHQRPDRARPGHRHDRDGGEAVCAISREAPVGRPRGGVERRAGSASAMVLASLMARTALS